MERPRRLSATFVRQVKEPGRYGDGRGGFGLSLLVKVTSVSGRLSKTWSQRLRIGGTPCNVGLGAFPVVTLAEAREAALENLRAVAQGRDPRERSDGVPTIEQAIEKVLAIHSPNWKNPRTVDIVRRSLVEYVVPKIGRRRVSEITTADVLAVLVPIWNEKRETAKRVRQRIGMVMKWAVAEGHREDNPAGDAIAAALPKNGGPATHRRALPHAEVAGAVRKVRESGAYQSTKLAFEFLILTAARSGEVRGATWAEIDVEARTWTVPADRMKAARDHRVPLSARAVAVLEAARELADSSGLVFPSARGKVMSDMTLSKLIRELGVEAVPHGFRSSFRDWAAECTDAPREVAELALAHEVGSAVERAYARSDLFDRRRRLMHDWAEYVRVS